MPKVLDEDSRDFVSESFVETNFMFLSSPFNTIFETIGLVFAKSLYIYSFQRTFNIPLSRKYSYLVQILSSFGEHLWETL